MRQEINDLGAKIRVAYDKAVESSLAHHRDREYLQADADADRASRLRAAWKALEEAYNAMVDGD